MSDIHEWPCRFRAVFAFVRWFVLFIPMSYQAIAHAQPDDASSGQAGEQTEEARDREARALYLDGETDYAAGRYEDAAAKFARAYELSNRPALLFNMANAYERMGDYQNALAHLERYLASPKVEDVVSVRERIKRLRATVAANQTSALEPAAPGSNPALPDGGESAHEPSPAVPNDPLLEPTNSDFSRSPHRPPLGELEPDAPPAPARWPAYLSFAAAGAALAGSVFFGVAARDAADEADAYCARQDSSSLCLRQAENVLARERRYARLADLSTATAIAAAGTGLYFALRAQARDSSTRSTARTSVAPWFTPQGAGLGLSGGW